MADAPTEASLKQAHEAVTRQGDAVRALKAAVKEGNAQKADVDAAIQKLKDLKVEAEKLQKAHEASMEDTVGGEYRNKDEFRAAMVNALERRLFYIPSFKIYGSVAGFYDYGPPGCAIKGNFTQLWRQHFVLEEGMLEVECPSVTPSVVLEASGHVERFTDFMVQDVLTKDCHRADHLLEDALETALRDAAKAGLTPERVQEARTTLATVGELDQAQLGTALKAWAVKAPETGNDITEPQPFKLMFQTSIGPSGNLVGYMRPETAQGIFVNFKDLLYYNGGKLPFAAAQIGQSYRNEIAPRAGLLRVREFTQAEIEHFCHPDQKDHEKFQSVAEEAPLLFSRELQMGEEKKALPMRLGEAVAKGIIANQTLAYFIGRTFTFLKRVGLNPERVRFRQHLQHEMAHYAEDCWDAEVDCTYGWVECVGLADRSAFDLRAHSEKSKVDLVARETFATPQLVNGLKPELNKKELGKAFKQQAKAIEKQITEAAEEDKQCWAGQLEKDGSFHLASGATQYTISPAMVSFKPEERKVSGRNYTPSVIEPSFGVGRILYCLFEHSFYAREGDAQRTVFRFSPAMAPVKVTVFPLLQREDLNRPAQQIAAALKAEGLSVVVDTTGNTIGRRYARTDEIGVPFAVTVDYETVEKDTVTVRERDTTKQVRVPVAEVPELLRRLSNQTESWEAVSQRYPAQAAAAE